MDVCYSGFLYSTLSTFNLSIYYLKQCINLHKNSGVAEAKTRGWLEPFRLSHIASTTTVYLFSNFRNGIVVNGEVRYLTLWYQST